MQRDLNKYLQPVGSPADRISDAQTQYVPWQWGMQQGVQLRKVRSSTAYFKNFAPGSLVGTITGGTMVNSQINNGTINNSLSNSGTLAGTISGGSVTINYDINLYGALSYNGISISSLVKELQIPLLNSGASGGAVTSFYTNNGTAAYIDSSRFTINPDNYPGASFFLEAVYRAGIGGTQTARTFNMGLWDVTGGSIITSSIISGTNQSGAAPASLPIVRGTTNFRTSMVSGNRNYVIDYYNDSSVNFVDLYQARLIIQY